MDSRQISGRHSNVFQPQAHSIDFDSYYLVMLIRMPSSIIAWHFCHLKAATHVTVLVIVLRILITKSVKNLLCLVTITWTDRKNVLCFAWLTNIQTSPAGFHIPRVSQVWDSRYGCAFLSAALMLRRVLGLVYFSAIVIDSSRDLPCPTAVTHKYAAPAWHSS